MSARHRFADDRGPLRGRLEEIISDRRSPLAELLRREAIGEMIREHSLQNDLSGPLWLLLVLGLWLEQHPDVSFSPRESRVAAPHFVRRQQRQRREAAAVG